MARPICIGFSFGGDRVPLCVCVCVGRELYFICVFEIRSHSVALAVLELTIWAASNWQILMPLLPKCWGRTAPSFIPSMSCVWAK